MASLPVEMQIEIMLRLPLRSLLRYMCVCKRWKSTIYDENFKTRYLQHGGIDSAPNSLFNSICSVPYEYSVSTPIRGWICAQSATDLRLCNPITNRIMHIPVLVRRGRKFLDTCLFGYDEANGVFKVLRFGYGSNIINSIFEVYTVAISGTGDGSWRPIACAHPYTVPPRSVANSLCKGGVLYYPAVPTIMSFDLSSEEFTVNQLPEGFIVKYGSTMLNYNGKVALVNNSATELLISGGFQICVRNEDSGQWELERVVIPDWEKTFSPHVLNSFVGTIGSGELVFTAPASFHDASEYVLYYKPGSGIRGPFLLEGANKGSYHDVRACLNHLI